jgi:hypothetical protein
MSKGSNLTATEHPFSLPFSQLLSYHPAYHAWAVSAFVVSGIRATPPPAAAVALPSKEGYIRIRFKVQKDKKIE